MVESKQWDGAEAGCKGESLLVKYLPYTHCFNVHAMPVAHAILLGLLKDFWNLLLCKGTTGQRLPRYALPRKNRAAMAARYLGIILNCDFGRPYRCVIKNRGNWVMEDWMNWLDIYSVYIMQPFQTVRSLPRCVSIIQPPYASLCVPCSSLGPCTMPSPHTRILLLTCWSYWVPAE
jgi:hypothetical protein